YQYLHHRGLIKDSAEDFIKEYIRRFHAFCDDVRSGKVQLVWDATFRKSADRYDDKKMEWLDERKTLLQDRMEAYGLKIKDLPDPLREYLLGYANPDYFKVARNKLKLKIEETKQMLKDTRLRHAQLKENPNVLKKDKPLKASVLADKLAADINFLKPPTADGKGRATEEQFVRLQEHLAYFSLRRQELADLFAELQLEGDGSAPFHPFLHEVNWRQCTGVLHFYQEYFERKIEWMKALKNQIEPPPPPKDKLKKNWGIKGQRILSLEELQACCEYLLQIEKRQPKVKNYRNLPLLLPRGMFNEAIAEALSGRFEEVKQGDNMVFCLREFLSHDTQPLFSLTRLYLFDEIKKCWHSGSLGTQGQIDKLEKDWKDAKKERRILKDRRASKTALQEAEYAFKDATRDLNGALEREQRLRQVQSADRALFLMVQDLASLAETEVKQTFENWSLAGIRYPAEDASQDGA
ncbi:MAG: type VI-B CRISPR-associated RNA-guided ribonuclease Cas13b, partial [Bacteroidota bacterium]